MIKEYSIKKILKNNYFMIFLLICSIIGIMMSFELYIFGFFYSKGKIIMLDNNIKLKYIFRLTILTIVSLSVIL
jgi:hypothetical protein